MTREVRPRFELDIDEHPSVFMARMARRLRAVDCPLCGVAAEGRVELYAPPTRQHMWSPELRVEVRPTEHGTRLSCMYAPHPHVWVAYAAILAVVAVATTAALTFALAEWMMQRPLVALYALPPLAVVGAVTYALAFVGQGLATQEMDELRAFLDDVVASSDPLPSGIRSRVPQPAEEPGVTDSRRTG